MSCGLSTFDYQEWEEARIEVFLAPREWVYKGGLWEGGAESVP